MKNELKNEYSVFVDLPNYEYHLINAGYLPQGKAKIISRIKFAFVILIINRLSKEKQHHF